MTERAQTVDQAMRLLRSIAVDGRGSAGVLAARLGLNRTVVYRLLRTLEAHGTVRRDGGEFTLGLELVALAHAVESDVRQAARPSLEWLTERSMETALLAVPDGDEAVAVDQVVPAERMVRVHYRPGFRHSLARGAHGRALLAFCPAAQIDRVVADLGVADAVRRRLGQTRRRGYAVSRNELQSGAAGVAAPVRDPTGAVVASIGVVVPVSRFEGGDALAQDVLTAAQRVSARIEHPGLEATDQSVRSERVTARQTRGG
jgi:IclR family transcriptional regulator, KDG regulon repressor